MKSLNKVQLLGHLGQDPETRYLTNGTAVVNLSIATTTRYKDRDTGEQKENTEWHRVVGYGKTAELISDMFKKGSPILVEGSLRTRKWQDRDDVERYTTEIVVSEFIAIAKREDADSSSGATPEPNNNDKKAPAKTRAKAAA